MLGASPTLRRNNPLNVGAVPPASPHTHPSRASGFVLWLQARIARRPASARESALGG